MNRTPHMHDTVCRDIRIVPPRPPVVHTEYHIMKAGRMLYCVDEYEDAVQLYDKCVAEQAELHTGWDLRLVRVQYEIVRRRHGAAEQREGCWSA